MKFERRPDGDMSIIKRLKHENRYIYYIQSMYGCTCGYMGCENISLVIHTVKVRDIATEELIKTKQGLNKVKKVTSNLDYTMTEEEVINIYFEKY